MALTLKENPPIESDADEQEVSRLSQRASVRRLIAELTLRFEKAAELQSVIDNVNAKSDAAAEEHGVATEPLQGELAELHEKQLDEIASKKESDKADADRRQALLQLIADANSELEKVVQANAATITKVEEQIRELQTPNPPESYNVTTLQNRLCGELARPELRDRSFALRERIKVANAWSEGAQNQLEKLEAMVANSERFTTRDVEAARGGMQRWQACIADARTLAADASAEVAELRRECIED